MLRQVSTEKYSKLIGLIYGCAIEPDRWEAALMAIRCELGFANAMLRINSLPSGALGTFVSSTGRQECREWVDKLPLCAAGSMCGSPWFEQWLRPQGFVDAVVLPIAKDQTAVGTFVLCRHSSDGEICEPELTALGLIGAHVRQAVAITSFLVKCDALSTFAATLEQLTTGIILVDANLCIIHANKAAAAMFEADDAILRVGSKIALPHATATADLAAAVAIAARGELEFGQRGIGIPIRNKEGALVLINVLPLGRGEIGIHLSAVAALFIAPAVASPQMPGDALALVFNLTPAETRVLELIAEGRTQAEIAHTLSVAPSTVKTHLLHVFAKTGTSRQSEIIKLMSALSLPLRNKISFYSLAVWQFLGDFGWDSVPLEQMWG
jgi:DNA-binding CsgD family transcriptional regulator